MNVLLYGAAALIVGAVALMGAGWLRTGGVVFTLGLLCVPAAYLTNGRLPIRLLIHKT